MRLPHVQLAVRALLNAEALNMVESVGNVTRRRTIPVIYRKAPGHYALRWVPAISGEALAHTYQVELVRLAKGHEKCRDALDYWSLEGEFLKHFSLEYYNALCDRGVVSLRPWECKFVNEYLKRYREQNGFRLSDIQEVEKIIVDNSVVEDVGGFLVEEGPVRRTSRVRFSYVIPTEEMADQAQVDHQMHVRGALKAQSLNIGDRAVQIPYYVQVGAALYGFNVELDLAGVGSYSLQKGEVKGDCGAGVRRRLALRALRPVLELEFGAKRSRYLPHGDLELALAVASTKPVPLPPASLALDSFLAETAAKLKAYTKEIDGFEYKAFVLVPPRRDRDAYINMVNEAFKKEELKPPEAVATVPYLLKKLEEAVGL